MTFLGKDAAISGTRTPASACLAIGKVASVINRDGSL